MKYKSKIIKSGDFTGSRNVTTFDIILRSNRSTKRGKCVIYPRSKAIEVEFEKKLTQPERLTVLKEIFYAFCITEATRKKNQIHEHIEEYSFIETKEDYSNKDPKTIIETIMEYDMEDFDIFNKKEKIISYIKYSCFRVQMERQWNQRLIMLYPVNNFSDKEIEVYKKILCRYLKTHDLPGKLTDISYKYRQIESIANPYYISPYVIYAFEYEIFD